MLKFCMLGKSSYLDFIDIRYFLKSPFSTNSTTSIIWSIHQINLPLNLSGLTYWLSFYYNSIKKSNIGVSELSHNGCLLEKLYSSLFRNPLIQTFNSYLDFRFLCLPDATFYTSKLTRSKEVILYSFIQYLILWICISIVYDINSYCTESRSISLNPNDFIWEYRSLSCFAGSRYLVTCS